MIGTKYTCDQCGIEKGATNHWYISTEHGAHGAGISFYEWDSTDAKNAQWKHLCGRACAQKFLESWLEKVSG